MTDELKAAIAAWLDADLKMKAAEAREKSLEKQYFAINDEKLAAGRAANRAALEISANTSFRLGDNLVVNLGNGNGVLLVTPEPGLSTPHVMMVRIEELQPEGGA